MRNIETTWMRLLKFSEHLSSDKIYQENYGVHCFYSDDESRWLIGREDTYHFIFPQIITEPPKVFLEFEKTKQGSLIYKPEPTLAICYAMLEFFGLELYEFLYLFTIDRRNFKKLHNAIYTKEFRIEVIAVNIYRFLQAVLDNNKRNR